MRRALALLTTFALVGCANTTTGPGHSMPRLKLVSYTSCDDLLSSVREAAKHAGFSAPRPVIEVRGKCGECGDS